MGEWGGDETRRMGESKRTEDGESGEEKKVGKRGRKRRG